MSDNHFITVSRRGVLMARRKGRAPVAIADAREGLPVAPDAVDLARGVPGELRVRFAHGGANRELLVTEVCTEAETLAVGAFQARFGVDDATLGRWLRASIEAALDRAGRAGRR